eukprot:59729-Prymnesium_polylepis.1
MPSTVPYFMHAQRARNSTKAAYESCSDGSASSTGCSSHRRETSSGSESMNARRASAAESDE